MDVIDVIAKNHNLKVIIDGAQSFSSTFNGKTDSNLGDISTTSFFPAKPLGCFGDGGAVFTNSEDLAPKMKQLRVHGQDNRYNYKYIGIGGRLDTIQAVVHNVKLKYYEKDVALCQEVAKKYTKALHLQEAFKYLGYKKKSFLIAENVSNEIISLPMNPFLSQQEINYICENL